VSERVLTLGELNRALLARQMLLERCSISVGDALERLVGMQSQEPQAPYIGLWSRLEGFRPEQLSDLIADRKAVRGALMRATVHLVTAADWQRLSALTAPVLARAFKGSQFSKQLGGADPEQVVTAARELLSVTALSRADLGPALAARWPGADPPSLAQAATMLMPVVQVPPRGLWRASGQAKWITADVWLPDAAVEHERVETIVRRYLAAFGPATVKDIQAWSGLTRLKQVVDGMREELCSFRDEQGRELLDVPGAPLPEAGCPAPARLLPPFDNTILGHSDRTRVIDPAHWQAVSQDRLLRMFLVDGFVAGSWSVADGQIFTRPLVPLSAKATRELAQETERLQAFLRA